MALHGGSTPPNRRPPPGPPDLVTIAQPRPDTLRVTNEYVDTPFRSARPGKATQVRPEANNNGAPATLPRRTTAAAIPGGAVPLLATTPSPGIRRAHSTRLLVKPLPVLPVTKQPGAVTFKKESSVSTSGSSALGRVPGTDLGTGSECCPARDSIICPECGRCRCESCRKPRPLPSRLLCHDSCYCYCSPETVLDYASCVCCVKAVFYHCSPDAELDRDGATCADAPCSCTPHRRCARWGCMALMSLVLPCLLCYWPLRSCLKAVETCHARTQTHGCRCVPRNLRPPELSPGKRLLDHPAHNEV